MNRQDIERVTDLLIEVGGKRAWVLIWDEPEESDGMVLASVPPEELPELVCFHLLRLLRHELTHPETIRREQ